MPSTYSPSLKLELIGAGEQAGVWNVTTNNNLGGLLEQAIAGRTTVNVTAGDVTLTSLNGVVDEARSAVLAVTGTPGVTRAIIIPDASKSYTVINTTTNIVQIKTAAGVAFNCAPSATSVVSCDGSNGVQGSTIASLTSPVLTGTPTAPTAAVTTNTTQIATTAFVNAEIENDAPTKTGGGASGTWGINITGNAATATNQSGGSVNATTGLFSSSLTVTPGVITLGTSTINGVADSNWGILYRPSKAGTVAAHGFLDTSGNAAVYFTNVGNIVAAGSLNAASLAGGASIGTGASGTWGINVTGNAATVTSITSGQVTTALGYTPVQQGGGVGQSTNKIYIGWSGSGLKATVDATDQGIFLLSNNYNSYAPTLTGGNASGTWGINITGNAASVTNGVYNNGSTYGINISGNSASTSQTNFSNLTIGGNQVLNAANYNSYAPTLAGTGATGLWNINVTGNANNITQYSVNQNLNTTADVMFRLVQTEQINCNTFQRYAAQISVLSGAGYTLSSSRTDTGSEGHFVFENGNGAVGTIFTNGSSTIYNTSSDYRLKNIIGDLTNSGSFIDALKPKVGTWKADDAPFVGFLAHEFQEVSPSSVSGTKDALDEEGKPVYQGMQASSAEVMANIVAELQSLRKRVAELEAS